MQKIPLFALIATILLSAGCFEPITSINIAEPLDSLAGNGNSVQKLGFGPIPSPPAIKNSDAVVRINTELPSLQPYVTVLRLPPNGLDTTQFQNLTTSMNMPVGLIGKQAENLEILFTWTNAINEVWSYNSNNRRLEYANAKNTPAITKVAAWPTAQQIEKAVDDFMVGRGMSPVSYRNPAIQEDWKEWKRKIDSAEACVNQTTLNTYEQIVSAKKLMDLSPPTSVNSNCLTTQFPSRIPVIFDLVIDERNIVNENGKSEIGGFLIFNAETLEAEYGWITLVPSPNRSDYPAISAEKMRQEMLNGGLGGVSGGSVDINETFFAFMELETGDAYGHRYLAPVLVGSGNKTQAGATIPYNIVVPLTK